MRMIQKYNSKFKNPPLSKKINFSKFDFETFWPVVCVDMNHTPQTSKTLIFQEKKSNSFLVFGDTWQNSAKLLQRVPVVLRAGVWPQSPATASVAPRSTRYLPSRSHFFAHGHHTFSHMVNTLFRTWCHTFSCAFLRHGAIFIERLRNSILPQCLQRF